MLEITAGTITGISSLAVPTSGEFRALGMFTQRITGVAGSTITATGPLTLGNATAVNGFYTDGALAVGTNAVTLADSNDAVLDSAALVTLGNGVSPGTLSAANGLTLDFGGNITGFGTITTPNNVAKPLINNGHITGNSAAQKITLQGNVKGVGTLDNVTVTGTLAPGLSPTSLQVGNLALSPTSTLVMELGGATAGSGYDQIVSSGALALDGTLQLALINGFAPAAGQSFDLFNWGGVSGAFDALTLPALGSGLTWNSSQLYTTGQLSVAPAFNANFDGDADVDAADLALWRGGFGKTTGATHLQGDANGDGDVDGGDLLTWQQQRGSSPAAASNSAAVPEPTAWSLAALAAIACLGASGRARGDALRRGAQ